MSDTALRAHWQTLRARGRTALIPYLTAGYPSRDASLEALATVVECGADLVEIGVPFSDPLADGPIIQRSSQRALEQGMCVEGVLQLVHDARLEVPIIVFGYLNPLLAYGLSRFLSDANAAGVAGLLLTDLPAGEAPDLERQVRESPLALIPLVAPTTTHERLRHVVASAEGFVYLIARLGVTGAATDDLEAVAREVRRVRDVSPLPVAVGFGIRDGKQAAAVGRVADGVVVGSALVERLGEGPARTAELMRELRSALDGERSGP